MHRCLPCLHWSFAIQFLFNLMQNALPGALPPPVVVCYSIKAGHIRVQQHRARAHAINSPRIARPSPDAATAGCCSMALAHASDYWALPQLGAAAWHACIRLIRRARTRLIYRSPLAPRGRCHKGAAAWRASRRSPRLSAATAACNLWRSSPASSMARAHPINPPLTPRRRCHSSVQQHDARIRLIRRSPRLGVATARRKGFKGLIHPATFKMHFEMLSG